MWRFWKKTLSSQQSNWVWVVAISSNMTINENIVTPSEERPPEDQSECYWLSCTKSWLESYRKCVWWTKDHGPCQKTITSGGAGKISQRRMGWDSTGDVSEPCWKTKTNNFTLISSKKDTQLTICIRGLIILTLIVFGFCVIILLLCAK